MVDSNLDYFFIYVFAHISMLLKVLVSAGLAPVLEILSVGGGIVQKPHKIKFVQLLNPVIDGTNSGFNSTIACWLLTPKSHCVQWVLFSGKCP